MLPVKGKGMVLDFATDEMPSMMRLVPVDISDANPCTRSIITEVMMGGGCGGTMVECFLLFMWPQCVLRTPRSSVYHIGAASPFHLTYIARVRALAWIGSPPKVSSS